MSRRWLWGLVASLGLASPAFATMERATPSAAHAGAAARATSASSTEVLRLGDMARAPGVVNLNEATQDELERLPGIGPTKARAIVEHRHARPFHRVDELMKVRGIGRKTFGKLRPYITIVGATTLKESPRE